MSATDALFIIACVPIGVLVGILIARLIFGPIE